MNQYLPLQFVPLSIELALVANLTYPLFIVAFAPTGPATGRAFATEFTSTSWAVHICQA